MKWKPRKRRGITYEMGLMAGWFFLLGVMWVVLYWGLLLPTESFMVGLYGSGVYYTPVFDFVLAFILFWPFILSVGGTLWLIQRSNKRGLTY